MLLYKHPENHRQYWQKSGLLSYLLNIIQVSCMIGYKSKLTQSPLYVRTLTPYYQLFTVSLLHSGILTEQTTSKTFKNKLVLLSEAFTIWSCFIMLFCATIHNWKELFFWHVRYLFWRRLIFSYITGRQDINENIWKN